MNLQIFPHSSTSSFFILVQKVPDLCIFIGHDNFSRKMIISTNLTMNIPCIYHNKEYHSIGIKHILIHNL